MKRLVISDDCEGATIETMRQAQEKFKEYGLPFSESCWIFAKNHLSLLDYVGGEAVRKQPDYDFLKSLLDGGRIDTLHTWGHFPEGEFSRGLARHGFGLLKDTSIRFKFWTAHGGERDYQNLSPLGQGDVKTSPYYHMDYTEQLGIRYFCLNTDIDVTIPARKVLIGHNFKRFRGPTKAQVRAITLKWFHKQIELAERRTIWHPAPKDVVIYTHFYAQENPSAQYGWLPMEEFRVPENADNCLRKLAERRDKGELEILTLHELFDRIAQPHARTLFSRRV